MAVNTTLAVGTTATTVHHPSPTERHDVSISNLQPDVWLFVGSASVTAATGVGLPPGATLTVSNTDTAVGVVSASLATHRVQVLYDRHR